MGERTLRRKLPKYVQAWVDHTGSPRHYFRREGFPRVALPGLPWSEEFMRAHADAMSGKRAALGARRTIPGSFSALCASYYNSTEFKSLVSTTRRTYRNIIEKFREENADKRVTALTKKDVKRLVDTRSALPAAAKMFLKVLRALMRHAIAIELIDENPCDGVKGPRIRSKGFHSWTDDEIAQYERTHPIGTKPRLALALLLYATQRRGDTVRMGRQHLRPDGIAVRQGKTGTELTVPIHPELARVLDGTIRNNLTFLLTEYGKPYSAAGFGNAMRDWCDQAGLHHCSAHGLRKASCRILAEAGCSASEIGAISGHRSLSELEVYVRAAAQKKLAGNAMKKISKGGN